MSNGFHLSPQQKNFYAHADVVSTLSQVAIAIDGELEPSTLKKALLNVIERHEILRTRFDTLLGMKLPLQFLHESQLDWQEQEHADERSAAQILSKLRQGQESNSQDNVVSALLIKQRPGQHVLAISMHPLFADSYALNRLTDEMALEYGVLSSGQQPDDAEEPLQYIDVSNWLNEWLDSDDALEGINYWKQCSTSNDFKVRLPFEKNAKELTCANSYGVVSASLNENLMAAAHSLSSDNDADIQDALLAAWHTLIYRLSDNHKPVIGVVLDGRSDQQLQETLGVMARHIPIEADFDGPLTFVDLVQRCSQKRNSAIGWQECFTWPAAWAQENPSDEFMPYAFATEMAFSPRVAAGVKFDVVNKFSELSRYVIKLGCSIDTEQNHVRLNFHYDSNRVSEEMVTLISEQYQQLLASALAAPETLVGALNVVPDNQRDIIVNEFNAANKIQQSQSAAIHLAFEAQAAKAPEQIALEFGGDKITYGELNHWSNTLAHELIEQGVENGTFVAVFAKRSFGLICAMLAISKVGGVYVPLDPTYPEDRIAFMLNDSKAKIVLCLPELKPQVGDADAKVIEMKRPDEITTAVANLNIAADENANAYLIYTSGSTGLPKGTLIGNKALVNHIEGAAQSYEVSAKDRYLLFAPANFDPSIEQIYVPLSQGATVVIRDEAVWSPLEIADKIEQLQLTVINFATAYWNLVVQEWQTNPPGERINTLRLTICGGDRMLRENANAWHKLGLNQVRLLNAYGPTEATITATTYDVKPSSAADLNDIPIGRALPGRKAYIVDENLNLAPIGGVGELCLGGSSLASGYFNRDEDTAKKFVRDPFSDDDNALMYRSGDMCFFNSQGEIHFVGRRDSQLKISGYRVELGEIEQVISENPEVTEVAVVVKVLSDTIKELVAFVTASRKIDLKVELQQQLADKLPEYMQPAAIVILDEFPLSPSGKVDRKHLTNNIETYLEQSETQFIEPVGDVEKRLAAIWQDIFQLETLSAHENFFTMGGHSLLAMKLVSQVKAEFEVALTIKDVFDSSDFKVMAAYIQSQQTENKMALPALAAQSRDGDIPLSYGQERLWILSEIGEGDNYHMPGLVRIYGKLDEAALENAINFMVSRHESLRTRFVKTENGVAQQIVDELKLPVEKIDLVGKADIDNVESFLSAAESWMYRPFDMETAPLMRVLLLQFGDDKNILGICMHHIIGDGYSTNILLSGISAAYEAFVQDKQPELPPLAVQYPDYAIWQRKYVDDKYLADDLNYWRKHLEGYENFEMVTDYPRPKRLSGEGERVVFMVCAEQLNALKDLCNANGVTLFSGFIAAVYILLNRYSNQTDFCMGIPVTTRDNAEIEKMIGMFINTISVKLNDQALNASKVDLLKMVHTELVNGQEHQTLPFEKLVDAMQPERDQSRNPLFQTMVSYFDVDTTMSLYGCQAEVVPSLYKKSKFDLCFDFINKPDGSVGIHLEYSADLYRRSTIDVMGAQLVDIVGQFGSSAQTTVAETDFCTTDNQTAIAEAQPAPVEVETTLTLDTLFNRQASTTPQATALVCEQQSLTYAELDERSNSVAAMLDAGGLQNGQFVGVYMDRSIDMVVVLLGIMKAGGAYVPLDPQHPALRLAYIIDDSKMSAVITTKALQQQLTESVNTNVSFICIEDVAAAQAPQRSGKGEDLAYAIYTSGSTGQPKGVKVSHTNVVNLLNSMAVTPGFTQDDTLLAVTTYSFDISVLELFLPLVTGGTCLLASDEQLKDMESLKATVDALKPSVMQMTPSAWSALFRMGWINEHGTRILCGGETLPQTLLEVFKQTACEVWNMYGPTETTIWSTVKKLDYHGPISIGTPVANTQAHILDEQLKPCPVNVPGQLYISGLGVTQGYINNPELTQATFIEHPVHGKMFNTGDSARWMSTAEGLEIHCLGRTDAQVKLRGFRVELGEIEADLLNVEGIEAAAAVVVGSGEHAQLVAYYEAENDQEQALIKQQLKNSLPNYMIPGVISRIDALPMTPNGKLDRKALAALTISHRSEEAFSEPQTQTERELMQLWLEVLNVERIGQADCFFELGGNSLNLVSLHSRVKAHFNVDYQLSHLFEYSTLIDMAGFIDNQHVGVDLQKAIGKADNSDNAPLSFAQKRLWLADQVNPGSSVYNNVSSVKLKGDVKVAWLFDALNEIARRHQPLRTSFKIQGDEGEAVQVIHPHQVRQFVTHDMIGGSEAEQLSRLQQLVEAQESRSFDLANGPVWDAEFVQLASDEVVMILNFHHICVDGWSMRIFIEEMNVLYNSYSKGLDSPLALPQINYVDYAVWQHEQAKGYDRHLAFWSEQLKDAPDTSSYLIDNNRADAVNGKGAALAVDLTVEQVDRLRQYGKASGATLFQTLLNGFNIAMHISTGETDLVIGTDVANRDRAEIEGLIGFFVNQVALRSKIHPRQTVRHCLSELRSNTIAAYSHQEVPFDLVVNHLDIARAADSSPLFQSKMFLESVPQNRLAAAPFELTMMDMQSPSSRLDLTLGLVEQDNAVSGSFVYNSALFNAATIELLAQRFKAVLHLMQTDDNLTVSQLSQRILADEAQAQAKEQQQLMDKQVSSFKRGDRQRKGMQLNQGQSVTTGKLEDLADGPIVYRPAGSEVELASWLSDNKAQWEADLNRAGALLFRGFNIDSVEGFENIGRQVMNDIVLDNTEHQPVSGSRCVQTPVNYAADKRLLWHNENTFNKNWPGRIMFGCATPALSGGETPLVSARKMYQALDQDIIEKFSTHGVMYQRNYSAEDGFGLSWKTIFGTDDKAAVERVCKDSDLQFEWKDNECLTTYAVRPAVVKDQQSGEMCWVNQAQHWHFSCLDKDTRQAIEELYSEEDYPRNCYFGNGDKIPDEMMMRILACYQEFESAFSWQQGDVLLVDNRLMAHGRNTYTGERKIWVCIGNVVAFDK